MKAIDRKKIINHYPPFTHSEDLKQICKPLHSIGINYFAHVHIDKKNQFSAIGLEPEFGKIYMDKSYHNFDIHMAYQSTEETYILWDLLQLDDKSKELRKDLHSFDLHHNFTIVQPGDSGIEYFHFAASEGNPSANNNYLKNLTYLKKFIQYFKEKTNDHKQLSTSFDFKFSIAECAKFSTIETLQIPEDIDDTLELNRIYIKDTGLYLTKRELECLHWLSMGKPMDHIAMILSITTRTVKAHIANVKSKLDCKNQFQLGEAYKKLKL